MLLTFNQAIRETLDQSMRDNSNVMLMGLGITDPKRFFGTTELLLEKYGDERVIECPTSENAYLGHALGLSIEGFSPVVHYQRMDFMLYAFDQLINNIAKWRDMFSTNISLPLVIRSLIGMGWGQGAQHSQNLAPLLSQIPGLKVVVPSCPTSAAQLLRQSLADNNPVLFTEHRWLQGLKQDIHKSDIDHKNDEWKIGKAKIRKVGNLLSIVTWSYSVVEALRLCSLFPDYDFEIIDLLTLSPLDTETVLRSYLKTKKMLIWEPASSFGGIGAELTAQLSSVLPDGKIIRLGYNFLNPPAAPSRIHTVYPDLPKIISTLNSHFNLNLSVSAEDLSRWPIDQENQSWNPWIL
jgi:pyruvate/2-oxoglutarate/acetoin dehydrogenase E1 component